jgi:hypothetical protein
METPAEKTAPAPTTIGIDIGKEAFISSVSTLTGRSLSVGTKAVQDHEQESPALPRCVAKIVAQALATRNLRCREAKPLKCNFPETNETLRRRAEKRLEQRRFKSNGIATAIINGVLQCQECEQPTALSGTTGFAAWRHGPLRGAGKRAALCRGDVAIRAGRRLRRDRGGRCSPRRDCRNPQALRRNRFFHGDGGALRRRTSWNWAR